MLMDVRDEMMLCFGLANVIVAIMLPGNSGAEALTSLLFGNSTFVGKPPFSCSNHSIISEPTSISIVTSRTHQRGYIIHLRSDVEIRSSGPIVAHNDVGRICGGNRRVEAIVNYPPGGHLSLSKTPGTNAM
jgi:hypothetical protein